MKKTIMPLVAATMLILQSCTASVGDSFTTSKIKESPITTETIRDTYVSAVQTSSGIKVEYIQGNDTEITIQIPQELKKHIEIKANGSVLVCRRTSNVNLGREIDKVKVTVTSPKLTEANASSGGSIYAASINMPGQNMVVTASSGAAVNISSLTAKNISATSSSGAALNLTGVKGVGLDLNASSGSAITAKDIDVNNVTAVASSGSALGITGKAADATLTSSSGAALSAAGLKAESLSKSKSSGGQINM